MADATCVVCKKKFEVKAAHVKRGWGKYCSKPCQFEGAKSGRHVRCECCGKEIYRRPVDFRKSKSKLFFCSSSCHCTWENKNSRTGENSPNWLTGKNVYRQILKRAKIALKCKRCGLDDERVLVVHHKDRNRKNNGLKNLEWLCHNCHCTAHLENKA